VKSLLFVFNIFLIFSLIAQEELTVSMKPKSLSVGEVPAFVCLIPQASYEQVLKDWEKYLKEGSKEKPLLQNGEIIMLQKEYSKISPNLLNIYSYVKEYEGEILLVAAIQLPEGFISKEMDEEIYLPAKKMIRDFAVMSYQTAVKAELVEAEKALKKLENQQKMLFSKKEGILFEINQYEREIVVKKDLITLNQIDQSNKVVQIQAQKEYILKLANAGEAEKEDAVKILKELEKEFKKMQNENEGHYQAIDNFESLIRQSDIALAKVENEMKFAQLDIDEQAYLVKKIAQKLEGIE
jgi:hypothetical protein